MKIIVCGSIGYGDIDEIKETYLFLRNEGFDIPDHILSKVWITLTLKISGIGKFFPMR
jgi:hypothetical protein